MIKIGNNELEDRYITDSNGVPTRVKKVYVGENLTHLHIIDNTPYRHRLACNGEIGEGISVKGSITNIKGNTVAWNQFLKENKLVDMGLPSGTLWASCDIDVTKEDKLCDTPFTYEKSFFSWGNVDGHNPISTFAFDYDWGSPNQAEPWYEGQPYGSTQGNSLTGNIPVGDTYDAARVNVGSLWRMPTNTEYGELFANIIYIDANGTEVDTTQADKRVTVNGVMGLYIQSKLNGARLFFSCSGNGNGRSWNFRGSYGDYWSSTWNSARNARNLSFGSGGVYPQNNVNRYIGRALRPVITKSTLVSIGKSNHKYALSSNNKNITDVTISYGSGNEPTTVEQFEADYQRWFGKPLTYEEYDAGSLRSVQLDAIKTVGFNQWDEEWENGAISGSTGTNYGENTKIRTKNYIPIFPKTSYYIKMGSYTGILGTIVYYDANKNVVGSYAPGTERRITTITNARYMRIAFYISYGATYNHDICINISNPAKDGTYVPYSTSSLPLTLTTLQGTKAGGIREVMFPDGLKKAGNVYDEIDYSTGKAIKRVGSVDLGSLDWNAAQTSRFYATLSNLIFVGDNTKGNVLCPNYITRTRNELLNYDKSICASVGGGTSYVNVYDTQYNTVSAFRSAMNGIMLYYELAKPIEYTLDSSDFPKEYTVNGLGTETIEPEDTSTVAADMTTDYRLTHPYYYGWDYNTSTQTVTRIGNTTWHKELPIQSRMRRCVVQDDGTVKYISSWDYTKYEDDSTVDYTGGDGQIMVEIPEYYYEAYEDTVDGVVHKILKLYPYAQIGQKSKKFYCGAFEGITDDASSNTPKLYSISTLTGGTKDGNGNYLAANWTYTTNAANYRGSGGTNDNGIKSNWSRPRTSLSITNFRNRATNRGTGWSQLYFTAYNSILRLYTVEYCNFNSQAAFTSTLTAAGYHQGGLGAGVTNVNSSAWSSFNSYNPFIPCGATKELGSNTGIIGVTYASGEFASSAYITYVPSYRGIENPFGHIWKWTDGYTKYGESSTATIYTCDDITKFSDSVTNQNVPDGYSAKGTHSIGEGNFGDWYWNSDGTFVHKTFGTGPFSDYAYHNNTGTRALCSGGYALNGALAGLFFWSANYDPSYVSAVFGGRLYYTPSEN